MAVIEEDVGATGVVAATAKAAITAEHERLISTVMREVPEWVEPDVAAEIELLLVEHGRRMDAAEFTRLVERVRAVLHG